MENTNNGPTLETLALQIGELSKTVHEAIKARGPGITKVRSPENQQHPMEKLILDSAKASDGTISLGEIAKKSGTSRANAWYYAKRLAAKGQIRIVSQNSPDAKRLSFGLALPERVVIS